MASVQVRIERLERNLNEEAKTVPLRDRFHLVYKDGDADRKITQIKEDMTRKYGTTVGLSFILSSVPEPLQLEPETEATRE